jgi:hypothetical protein
VGNKDNVGSFGRLAQAAYLLSRAIEATKIDDPEDRSKTLSDLDSDLQQLLGRISNMLDSLLTRKIEYIPSVEEEYPGVLLRSNSLVVRAPFWILTEVVGDHPS